MAVAVQVAALAAILTGVLLAFGLPTALIVGGVLVLVGTVALEVIGTKR